MIQPSKEQDYFYYGITAGHRYCLVDISHALEDILSVHPQLGDDAAFLLSNTLVGVFLISDLVKQDTKVSMQISFLENSPIHSVLAYSNRSGELKGSVRYREDILEDPELEITGVLKVFRWKEGELIYQSFTSFSPDNFEDNIRNYLRESEQLKSHLKISVQKVEGKWYARGLLLQALPGVSFEEVDQVKAGFDKFYLRDEEFMHQELPALMELLKSDLNVPALEILQKGSPIAKCDCSREKIAAVILSLGEEYAEEVVRDEGKMELTCEFCNTSYIFNQSDIDEIFS